MKTTKILSVLLALVMLVGMFSVVANAGGTESAVDMFIDVDKTSYNAGDTVTLTISEQVVAAVGDMTIAGQYPVAYNSAIMEPLAPASNDLADHGFAAIAPGYDASVSVISLNSNNESKGYSYTDAASAANGWNETILYCVGSLGDTFDATSKTDLFTVQFKLKDGIADGDYVIGFNQSGYELYDAFSSDAAMGGVYGYTDDYGYGTAVNYGLGTATIHVGAATVADPAYLKTQCQWADGNTAGNLNVGISATFSTDNYPIAFNEAGTSTNVTAVGVDVTSGAYTTTQETQFVYEVDATTYRYRAVITGVPHDASGELTVQFYIVINGEKKLGEIKTINLGDVIAASHSNGLPAYTGA